jgi:hypothetical protein
MMGVLKKQAVYSIDYYGDRNCKRECIDPEKQLEETVLRERNVEIADGKYLHHQKDG